MKVWLLRPSENNTMIKRVNYEDGWNSLDFVGEKIMKWEVPQYKVYKKGRYKDYAYLKGGIPVFSKKCLEVVGDLISNDVQLLDVNVVNHDVDLKIVNVTNVLDATDYSASIPERSTYDGRLVGFKKLSFIEDVVKDQVIFKTPEFPETRVFVTDAFRELVLRSKLKGFVFYEVWDSEWTDEQEKEQHDRYDAFLLELESNSKEKCSWSEAIVKVELGQAVVSKDWKMQLNRNGIFIVGKLGLDCEYVWSQSDIIPPILLGLQWHEAEKSDI